MSSFLPLIIAAMFTSCVFRTPPEEKRASTADAPREPVAPSAQPGATAELTAAVQPTASGTWRLVAAGANGAEEIEAGTLSADPDCAAGRLRAAVFTTAVTTVFGDTGVSIALGSAPSGDTGSATVSGTFAAMDAPVRFALRQPVVAGFAARLCDPGSPARHTGRLRLEGADLAEIGDWLGQLAPDCETLTAAHGKWNCRLAGTDPAAARAELTGVQTTMVRRWNRQPYLLARRLAVGLTLAKALESMDAEARLNTFCNVIRHSLAAELPVTMISARWQAATCDAPMPVRAEAAAFGLAKAVAEIDFLRQLYERTSRMGFLTLRIPAAQLPARDILVSLIPEADVLANLTTDAEHLAEGDNLTRACWHPLYAESTSLMGIARRLGLAGESARGECRASQDAETHGNRYVAEAVTSETEFIISNGRAKTLRLPGGNYRYTLRPLPEDQTAWDDASQQGPAAEGQIKWDGKRPAPVITSW